MTFRRGDVVLVAFPHVESRRWVKRPALVVSDAKVFAGQLFWVLMITDEANDLWPLDVALGPAWADYGLRTPSRVRVEKVTVVETNAAQAVGRAPDAVMAEVQTNLRRILGLTS